jgi:DeoR/GlpR family transcriptional regulator of sugar metabolism
LVVDHSKFGQVATAALGPLSLVNRIVTDEALSPQMSARFNELNIELILA